VKPRLLFFSNLFPTVTEPYRGLDNATLLHALSAQFDIRVLSPRASLPWKKAHYSPRAEDATFSPRWQYAAYLPMFGGSNDILMAKSGRVVFDQVLEEAKPDVVLSSWIFPDSCAAIQMLSGRKPLIAIAQGTDIHMYLKMLGRRQTILKYLPWASAVITRSGELSRLLADAHFPTEKLHTIYNGVSHELFQPRDQAAARASLNLPGLPANARVVLFVGNFYLIKNPLLLIRALAKLDAVHLIMAGGGQMEEDMHSLAIELRVAERVHFVGRQDAEGVARLMNAADLLAITSHNEGVPNVLLEAFASGLPVASSRVGGIPEVLNAPFLGRLFAPNDLDALATALAELLNAPRDTVAIRAHSMRFTWEAAAGAYAGLLNAAINTRSR
jgi:teichuronic acid biosynthesis glycosyltransferase TuaC